MIGFSCNTAIGCYLEYVTIMSTPTLQTKLIESFQNTIQSHSFVIRCILNVQGLELNTAHGIMIRLNIVLKSKADPAGRSLTRMFIVANGNDENYQKYYYNHIFL